MNAAKTGSSHAAEADSTTAGPLLRLEGLTVRYGLATALRGLSLELREGNALAVLGVNGAGKSTLARALSGLVPSASGTIEFDGQDITKWPAHKVRRAGLIYLPEGRGIFSGLTVTENLRLAAGVLKSRSDRVEAVAHALDMFPSLKARANNHAAMLSGGEQQMLSLARALTTSPRLIIADEMSLGLAPKMVDAVFETLETMKRNGATIILIEQFANRALAFADQCVLLQRGRMSWHGPSDSATDEVLAGYLGDSVAATP